MNNDITILEKISRGDESAFRLFFEQRRSKLFIYLCKVTKSKEIAEELVIDVFLKIWLNKEYLPEVQNIDAFLYKIAQNKALDFLRMAARDAATQKLIAYQIGITESQSADYHLLETEYHDLLQKALENLSPKRRDMFTLSRVDGLTYEEIAKKMNVSQHTVRNTIAQTLKSIRQFLQGHQIDNYLFLFYILPW